MGFAVSPGSARHTEVSRMNATFICWHCHTAYRSQVRSKATVKRCAECGREINWISTKVEIPRKTDSKAWKALRDDLLRREDERLNHERLAKQQLVKRYKEQIANLHSRAESKDRKKAVQALEKKLAKLQQS